MVRLFLCIAILTPGFWQDIDQLEYIAVKTATAYPPPHPIDGIVTLALPSGAWMKVRATDVDYDRTAAYSHDVVIKAQTVTLMIDPASRRPYLRLGFNRFVSTVWKADVDQEVMSSGFAAYYAKINAAVGSSGPDQSNIAAKCAKDWPDDFRMRRFCEGQQETSRSALAARTMTSTDERTIRTKCAKDWPDDFHMRNFCEEQQLKAIRR